VLVFHFVRDREDAGLRVGVVERQSADLVVGCRVGRAVAPDDNVVETAGVVGVGGIVGAEREGTGLVEIAAHGPADRGGGGGGVVQVDRRACVIAGQSAGVGHVQLDGDVLWPVERAGVERRLGTGLVAVRGGGAGLAEDAVAVEVPCVGEVA